MNNEDGLASDDVICKSNNESDFYNQQNFSSIKPNELEEMEVPKCLGDIFESVAGAIFLDSNKSFDTYFSIYNFKNYYKIVSPSGNPLNFSNL